MKIALSGVAGAGKDYFGAFLIEEYGFYRVSFSDQLKKICADVFDWMEVDYPPEVKEKPLNITTSMGELITMSPREIWLKMNYMRKIENELFVRKLYDDVRLLQRQGVENVLITDIRTKNEMEFCKDNGFTTIRIVAPKDKIIHKTHDFDKQLDDAEFDFEFQNNFNGTEEFKEFFEKQILERI